MATRDDTDLERPRLPLAIYLVVGVLAVIGLFSIFGFVLGTISLLIRLVIFGGLALLVLWGLKAIVFGSSRH
jgi:hypothetical protein